MNDQLIIDELKKGNTKVFSLVYSIYPTIEGYIINNNGSKEDAKDIFQNALIVLYKKVKSPEFELTAKLSTYLFSICKNNWLKALRNKKKASTQEINNDVHQLSSENENSVNETGIIACIQEKLTELGDPCKSLIVMHEFHKIEWKIIAEKMNYATAHAARNQKYKCLLRLKKLIPEQLKNALLNG